MFTEQHAVNDSEAATCRFHFSLSELASQRSGPCLGPCRGAQPMLFIQKKVSAEPSGDVGARRYQATRSVKQPFAKTPLSGRLDPVRCQLIDLPEALEVRVAQEDRPNGVGNICIAILAGKLQALGVPPMPHPAGPRSAPLACNIQAWTSPSCCTAVEVARPRSIGG